MPDAARHEAIATALPINFRLYNLCLLIDMALAR